MSVISRTEVEHLRQWVRGLGDDWLKALASLARENDPAWTAEERQGWFRLGRLVSEEMERRGMQCPSATCAESTITRS